MSYAHDSECRCPRCTVSYCPWCDRPRKVGERHLRCEDEQRACDESREREYLEQRPMWEAMTRERMGELP